MTEIVARKSLRLRGILLVNRLIQWISLAVIGEWAFYGVFRCPFVIPFVSCQNCPVLTCPGRLVHTYWGVWAAWLAFLVFLGRGFCGWICPLGLVNRLLAKFSRPKWESPKAIKTFSYGKYLVLFGCILVYFLMNQPRANVPIRIGEFWPAVLQTYQFASDLWLFRSGLLLVMLALGLFLGMAWCRLACPMGGLLELVKSYSLFRFTKGQDCNNCNACKKVCYMHTRPEESNCTNCGDCMQVCPQKCIHFKARFR
ncbi:MAG: 4Fe-4S binding protein [Desulfovibrionaceae bacterium]|nr:4Fe-4S binding protein [Desulfovibrionaceae bacterium]